MIKRTRLDFVFFICMATSLIVSIGNGYAAESITVGENRAKLIKTNSCRGCDLAGVNLNRVDLSNADLEGADLSQAKMYLANLTKANLRNANLRGVSFGGADLADADLRGADLRGTSLAGAYLGGTLLDGMLIATKPYDSEDLSELEKEVYVADQSKPKEKPKSKEVVVAPRRVFEEPPPVLVVQQPEAKSEEIIYPQAPEVKKMTPMSMAKIEEKIIDKPEVVEKKVVKKKSVDSGHVAATKKSITTDNKENDSVASTALSETMEVGNKNKNLAADKKKRDNLTRLFDTNKCYGCDLSGLDLSKKDLDGADLEKADLTDCNLEKASLEEANLKGALLLRANLRGADLEKADFYRADLSGADMTGAKTEGTLFDSAVGVNKASMLVD